MEQIPKGVPEVPVKTADPKYLTPTERAAQIWCRPEFEKREMDAPFAHAIAEEIKKAVKLEQRLHPIGTIGWAVSEMKFGKSVHRRGWKGKDLFINIQINNGHIWLGDPSGTIAPWESRQFDLLAIDWEHAE